MPAIRATASRIFVDKYNFSTSVSELGNASEQDEIDVTTIEGSSNFRAYITGFRGGTFNMSGFMTVSTTASSTKSNAVDPNLYSMLGSTDPKVLTFVIGGNSVGANAQLFRGIQNSLEQTSAVGEAVGFAAVFRNSEGPQMGRVLRAHSTQAFGSTGASSAVDGPTTAGSAGGGVAHLHVTSFTTSASSTAADTFTVKVQHSSAGVAWADLASWTVTGKTVQRTTAAGTIKRYLREARTVAGPSGGGAKYVVAFARNNP